MCENLKATFLCDQRSDLVHILQFDSTDEYFETVKYEGHAAIGSRDILGKPLGRPNFHSLNSMDFPQLFQDLVRITNFEWIDLGI